MTYGPEMFRFDLQFAGSWQIKPADPEAAGRVQTELPLDTPRLVQVIRMMSLARLTNGKQKPLRETMHDRSSA